MIGVGTFKTSATARKYINQVLDSERLSYGPFSQKFESVFAAAHGCRFAVLSNSGTSSLLVSLAALRERYGWQDGDEVIVPAVTFVATSNVVLQLNLKPVFVDVEPQYYGIDPAKLEDAITSRTRCIIPVHLFGHPCAMEPIMEIAKRRGLQVVEDSCETMFARYQGRSVGSFGDIGCFSTYVAHILVTGVGGLSTTNDPELAVALRSIVNHGRDSIYLSIDDDKNKSADELRMIISKRFSFVRMGYSFRVTEFESALGLAEFERHEEMISKRRENGAFLTKSLAHLDSSLQLPRIRPDAEHSFMMYPVVLRNEPKEKLVNFLENNGVETREMLPLINQPYYRNFLKIREEDFPVAKWINASGFYVASHQDLTMAEKEHMVRCFDAYFSSKRIKRGKAALVVMSKLAENQFDELRVQNFLESLPRNEFDTMVLADGAESPSMAAAFERSGFRVIQRKAAKGRVLSEALETVLSENIVVIGIDGTDNVQDISSILLSLRKGNDLVIGSRFILGGRRAKKGFITHRSFGNRFFAFLVGLLFQSNVSDTNNLFRGFKRSLFNKLHLDRSNDEVMFEMTVRALEIGASIDEFPTAESNPVFSIEKRSRFLSAATFMRLLFGAAWRRMTAFKADARKLPELRMVEPPLQDSESAEEAKEEERKTANL